MSDQHTPGPWNVGKSGGSVVSESPLPGYDGRGGHDEISYYGGHLIAESIWRTQDVHLIAAAPDLLAELRNMVTWCGHRGEALGEDKLLPIERQPPEVQAAMRAIAKAEGAQL